MADGSATTPGVRCLECGFEAAAGSDDWEEAIHPSLGTLARCPDCGSTNTTSR
jgi:DNA-directed RNA polymerase subunit RPC12/RpoP